jgi:hypothetical protein
VDVGEVEVQRADGELVVEDFGQVEAVLSIGVG